MVDAIEWEDACLKALSLRFDCQGGDVWEEGEAKCDTDCWEGDVNRDAVEARGFEGDATWDDGDAIVECGDPTAFTSREGSDGIRGGGVDVSTPCPRLLTSVCDDPKTARFVEAGEAVKGKIDDAPPVEDEPDGRLSISYP